MPRRRPRQEEENNDRWVVSYADFITLLLGFFVVMYSLSSVNEGKYRVLSRSLNSAFGSSPGALAPAALGLGEEAINSQAQPAADAARRQPLIFPLRPPVLEQSAEDQLTEAGEEMEALSGEVTKMMSRYIDEDLVAIRRDSLWLEIEIKTRLLFESGSARPAQSARPVLQQLAEYFSLVPNAIQVEGYTDDEPISTPLFPSNWELSSARAAAVVRQMVAFGVQPGRMASVGYAEFRPIADNGSPEGRQRNRRVVIKLMADLQPGDLSWQRSVQTVQAGVPAGRSP